MRTVKRLKPLMPSLREKKRYILYEVISKEDADINEVVREIDINCKNMLGTIELAKAGVIHLKKRYNPQTKRGVLRVNNKYVDKIITSMTLITKIKDKEAIIRSLYVSGILKKMLRIANDKNQAILDHAQKSHTISDTLKQ